MENEEVPESGATPEVGKDKKENAKIEQLEKDVARLTKELEQAKILANTPKREQPEESDFDRIFKKEIR